MNIVSFSFAYPEVGGDDRAAITDAIGATPHVEGTYVLSTCLRTEFAAAGREVELRGRIEDLVGVEAASTGRLRTGSDATHHLFRVAAGLESPVTGEREILTQFRSAVAAAEQDAELDGLFVKLLETAIATGRGARDLLPEMPQDSMAAVAAEAVSGADRVAVLGSGVMARAVVRHVRALPSPPAVTIVARTPERIERESGIDVVPFDRAADMIGSFPAVVSATSAKGRLVVDDDLATLLAARTEPLVLVDMAMPPDFTPPADAPIEYIDIDHLASLATRRTDTDDAELLVRSAAFGFHQQMENHHAVAPVVGGLMQNADVIVDRTVDRFSSRLSDTADADVLRQAAHTVARTLLSSPAAYLRSSAATPAAIHVIADAFGLDGEQPT